MTAKCIGTPIGYPIASGRVYPNRGRIAPIVSARVNPSVVTAVSGFPDEDQIQSHRYLGAFAARLALEIEQ